MEGGLVARVAVHVHQPGHRPQPLERHEPPDEHRRRRRVAPEDPAPDDAPERPELLPEGLARPGGRLLGREEDADGRGERQGGQGEEDPTPAQRGQRAARGVVAVSAPSPPGHHHCRVQRWPALRGEPDREDLEAGHEAGGGAEPDGRAGQRQLRAGSGRGRRTRRRRPRRGAAYPRRGGGRTGRAGCRAGAGRHRRRAGRPRSGARGSPEETPSSRVSSGAMTALAFRRR